MNNALVILYKDINEDLANKYESLYKDNFEKIFHLMPFYKGDRKNVIPVFENKYQLNGYITQARKILSESLCDNFIIITDDCVINPCINSYNIFDKLNIKEGDCFFSEDIFTTNINTFSDYDWMLPSVLNFYLSQNGAQMKEFIPIKVHMRAEYNKLGLRAPFLYTDYVDYLIKHIIKGKIQNHEFFYKLEYSNLNIKNLTSAFTSTTEKEKLVTLYPFAASLSKFFIINKSIFENFAHYLGMFASIRVHYNIGFAMSAVLSTDTIKSKKDIGGSHKIVNCEESMIYNLYKQNQGKLENILSPDTLVYYPIDLMKWKTGELNG